MAGSKTLRVLRWIGVPILAAALMALATYFAARTYVLRQAEANIRDVLLSHRGLHLYIQRTMHPEFYAARDAGRIPADFYSPVILSSSHMVRVMHGFFNEERVKDGLPAIYYKMAADNPRNPVNQATPMEADLIRMFNANRNLHDYRATVKVDGERFLLRAIPFLENTEACLRCHGRRSEAPPGLQALYPGEGGFNERVGTIRAVEIIRAPIAHEIQTAAIASAAVTGGLLGLLLLLLFNTRLRGLVQIRTAALELEIQERRHAEAEVRELNQTLELRVEERTAQLSAVNRELDAFAYSVSHDLRAPLRAIDGFSQALQEDCGAQLDGTARDYLQRVRKGCTRMGHLIEDLLQLSRLTRRELERREVDLSSLANEAAGELRAGAPQRVAIFTIAPGLRASGDQTLLRAVLDNLLGNAFKFTALRPEAHIEFGSLHQDGQPVFFVRDNGAGFDMQYADKLFGTFQRLHGTEAFEGTGIGLATVQRIITRHGGRIWAEAAVDQGATFYFTL
jgi:signal transduction histidine kinase